MTLMYLAYQKVLVGVWCRVFSLCIFFKKKVQCLFFYSRYITVLSLHCTVIAYLFGVHIGIYNHDLLGTVIGETKKSTRKQCLTSFHQFYMIVR